MQRVYTFLTCYILKIVIGNLYESKCDGVEYMISLKHSTYYLTLYFWPLSLRRHGDVTELQ